MSASRTRPMQAVDNSEALLNESVRNHGHLCPGQVLGVRMSILGLRSIGVDDPKGSDRKKLIVFVETDRCAADALQSVTGCSLGKRTLKFVDYGKMAATFVNLRTGRAVRIVAKEEARDAAHDHAPGVPDKYEAQAEAYRIMADGELFHVYEVDVDLRPEDMPGRPLRRVRCNECGEQVQDMREIRRGERMLCRACATGGYYRERGVSLPVVMQNCHNGLEVRSKIWIEAGGDAVFGKGRRMLLEAIDTHGSINKAAGEVGISFRKAWGHIKAMEDRFGVKLVLRKAGGRYGGGAVITPEAREFLSRFKLLEQGLREFTDQRFEKVFGGHHVR